MFFYCFYCFYCCKKTNTDDDDDEMNKSRHGSKLVHYELEPSVVKETI